MTYHNKEFISTLKLSKKGAGMLSSILNIGICKESLGGLLRMTGNPRFVWDSYRRLIETYAEVVYDCSLDPFRSVLDAHLKDDGANTQNDLDVESLKSVVKDYLKIFAEQTNDNKEIHALITY
jgi:pyruvate,orthophosphate dikinase